MPYTLDYEFDRKDWEILLSFVLISCRLIEPRDYFYYPVK